MRFLLRLSMVGLCVCGWTLFSGRALPATLAETSQDEAILKKADVATTGPGLLEFFRKRTLTGAYQERIVALVQQLGDSSYKVRRQASKDLIGFGAPALPVLRRALKESEERAQKSASKDSELELQMRASKCIRILEKEPGPALPLTALRLLRERKPDGACPVLLGYVPFADNAEVEEEVLESLRELGTRDAKAEPVLMAALADMHLVRRAAAAFVVGRVGNLKQRPAVRKLLKDTEARVRLRAAQGILSKEVYDAAANSAKQDEKLLQEQKVPADEAGLLAFIKKRTLSKADQEHLRDLVRQLGSKTFRIRNKASKELMAYGSGALPYLQPALQDPDVEVKERAGKCVAKIKSGPATALPAAVVRLLRLRAPDTALRPLLAFVPFADDESVEEEVLNALCVLNLRDEKIDPVLTAALADEMPARRAAAVFVLGRVGTPEHYPPLRKLLVDRDPKVRFHTAQVLLTNRDKAAVPVLVGLLTEAPIELALKAEDLLAAVNSKPVTKVELTEDAGKRRKVRSAWSEWWKANEARIDLARINFDTEQSRMARASKITLESLHALLRLDKAGFKKTLKFPFYMEGMGGGGDGLIRSADQVDFIFQQIEQGGARAKEEFKKIRFKVKRVGRLDDFLKRSPARNGDFFQKMRERENAFLKKFRKAELYLVYIGIAHETQGRRGEDGVVFVRMVAGRPFVIGLGPDRAEEASMKVKKK
jgi:HEAT repeat protein